MNQEIHYQIQKRAPDIERLCQQCHVLRLDMFGSATLDRFDAAHSDLDFLVTFKEGRTSLDHYLGLAEGLESLLGHPVDLVIERAIRNPYFRESVNATRRLIYDQQSQETAA